MADITMCKGATTLQKEIHPTCLDCYRRIASPTLERQSYFMSPPLVEVHDSVSCVYYWKETK